MCETDQSKKQPSLSQECAQWLMSIRDNWFEHEHLRGKKAGEPRPDTKKEEEYYNNSSPRRRRLQKLLTFLGSFTFLSMIFFIGTTIAEPLSAIVALADTGFGLVVLVLLVGILVLLPLFSAWVVIKARGKRLCNPVRAFVEGMAFPAIASFIVSQAWSN